MSGLSRATGDAAVVMDADLQHPPSLLPRMIDAWRSGFLVVNCIKEVPVQGTRLRKGGARMFYRLCRRLTGMDLSNATDFKLLDRKAIEIYLAMPERCRFFRGLVEWCGLPSTSIKFQPPSAARSSRWSFMGLVRYGWDSILSFTALPLRLVTWTGGFFLLFAVILGMQTLWRKLNGTAIEGFTTVILLELFLGSMIMISLGMIGEFVARIFDEIKARPQYVESEILEERGGGYKVGGEN